MNDNDALEKLGIAHKKIKELSLALYECKDIATDDTQEITKSLNTIDLIVNDHVREYAENLPHP